MNNEKIIRFDAITCPKVDKGDATISMRSNMIYFNKVASRILALKQGDKFAIEYDKATKKLYLVLSPDGFELHKKDDGYIYHSTNLIRRISDLIKVNKFTAELGEFNEGRWPIIITT